MKPQNINNLLYTTVTKTDKTLEYFLLSVS